MYVCSPSDSELVVAGRHGGSNQEGAQLPGSNCLVFSTRSWVAGTLHCHCIMIRGGLPAGPFLVILELHAVAIVMLVHAAYTLLMRLGSLLLPVYCKTFCLAGCFAVHAELVDVLSVEP